MIGRVLIANRGEIACRITDTCQRLGIYTTAIFSEADAGARHVRLADEALLIGPAPPSQSYLSIDAVLRAAHRAGVDAIHPGCGFLAENAEFARACESEGFVFIGPPAAAIEMLGDKRSARRTAGQANLPLIPGYDGDDQSNHRLIHEAQQIGYPLLIKAAAGGGGKGMRLIEQEKQLIDGLESARNEANKAFGSADLLLEKVLAPARHIEIQVLADRHGHIVHLGERDCSLQRRFQKVIEETPSPAMTAALREQMGAAAVNVSRAVNYENAGTVEFLLDADNQFYFLEMNTRLQVEHPITEMVTGIDLVEWQIRIAEGEALPFNQGDLQFQGHAIEARLYAEDPARGFLPVTGDVLLWRAVQGEGIRVDSGLKERDQVSMHYDPLLAKIIVHAADRKTAVRLLIRALQKTVLLGIKSNRPFLIDLLNHEDFHSGATITQFINTHFPNWGDPGDGLTAALLAISLARYRQLAPKSSTHWRNNPNQPIHLPFNLKITGEKVDIFLTPLNENSYMAAVSNSPGEEYTLQFHQFENSILELSIDEWQQKIILANQADDWWVQVDSSTFNLQALPRLPKPRPHAGSGASLRAPMPGSILAVLVEVGQEVQEGQALIRLEAMKMEHTIRTAAPGKVKAIFYKPGDTVEADTQLLILEEI